MTPQLFRSPNGVCADFPDIELTDTEFQPEILLLEEHARRIASRFQADYHKTLAALQRLLDGNLPWLIYQQNDLPASVTLDVSASVLEAAYRALTWQRALVFLEKCSLDVLAERLRISSYLAGEDIPLFSRAELAEVLNAFQRFLEADREHLLRAGLPSKEFGRSRWLEVQLAKLYPVQRTENCEPFEESVSYRGKDAYYYWVKVVPDARGLGVHRIRVPQDEAGFLEGFKAADALRLEQLRGKVFDLKLTVLEEAERALRSPDESNVWPACLDHLVTALSADEVEFLSRMDSAYENPPAGRNLSHALAALLGHRVPFEPGGFSNLIELIGHVEQECTIGTMHKTREALRELVKTSDTGPVLCSSTHWPYFGFLNQGHEEAIESAIRIFLECEAKEVDFWPQFHDRVTTAVAQEFDQDVTISFRARRAVADNFRQNVLRYGEWAKSCLEASGKMPALQLEVPVLISDVDSGKGTTADGPCHPYTWRHDGQVVNDEMQPAAWKMVNYLLQQADRSATFDALQVPTYADAEHEADANAFGSLRRAANRFFSTHEIPLRVSITKTVVSLMAAN